MRLHFFTLMSAAIGLFLCCPTSALADDSSSALHKAGLSKEMAAALSKKDPEFVLFTLEAFSPSIQAKFKPTKRNPSPA